jgi:aminoglycoside phosphotransferase (APT) family kinase protein
MERARGTRITWDDLPDRVKAAIEENLGGRVVETLDQAGGFSPGLATRVRAENGARAFVKAASQDLNPITPDIHRREARVAPALPPDAPVSHLVWVYDEGEDGWVVLAFADVDGHIPACPWEPDELRRVVDGIVRMHAALTPCPIQLPTAGSHFATGLRGWSRLTGDERGLDAWSRTHLTALAALEADAPHATAGETLLHLDLRADNILLTEDDIVVVDWPNASIGAPWVDMLCMAPSVTLEGGPDPETFVAMHPAVRDADPRKVDAVLASLTGYFTRQALQPDPPGLPTLRAFQAAQGEVCRLWLAGRLGLR